MILLTPGPVTTSPRVRQAAVVSDLSHRDPTFARLGDETAAALRRVAGAPGHDAILFGGSATGATEAALGSLMAPAERILIPSNGAFGERIAEIARVVGLRVRHLRQPWGEPIAAMEVERVLRADPPFDAVAMVHHETSIGRVNPVEAVGALAAASGARFIVDVVSSLGAELFDARACQASVVIGAPNKCLHGIPGVSFVLVHPDVWLAADREAPRSMYLDLRRYRESDGSRKIPFTPPVAAVAALHEALQELVETGGVPARRARYQDLNARIKAGLAGIGLELFFDGASSSCALTVAGLPPARSFRSFHDALKLRGFVIYEAKDALRDRCFLVANMGHLDTATIDRFLQAVREVVAADGVRDSAGAPEAAVSRSVRRS